MPNVAFFPFSNSSSHTQLQEILTFNFLYSAFFKYCNYNVTYKLGNVYIQNIYCFPYRNKYYLYLLVNIFFSFLANHFICRHFKVMTKLVSLFLLVLITLVFMHYVDVNDYYYNLNEEEEVRVSCSFHFV